jgi:hypothetical protein
MTRSFRQQARSCFPAAPIISLMDPIISLMEVPATIDAMIAGGEILPRNEGRCLFLGIGYVPAWGA